MKNKVFILLVLLLATLAAYFATLTKSPKKIIYHSIDKWDEQLNSMDYLIIYASSVNLTNALKLSKEQINNLQELSNQVFALQRQMPDNKVHLNSKFEQIGETYKSLIRKLRNKVQLDDSFKNEVNNARQQEIDIIKRSLLAANQIGYKGESCRECHAPPASFLKGNIADKYSSPITSDYQKKIDMSHLRGLFGDSIMMSLWNLRDTVYNILTDEQHNIFRSFRFCMIPQENVIENGVKKINKNKNTGNNDFEIQKENMSFNQKNDLNNGLINRKISFITDEYKFIAVILLLFPGSNNIYSKLLPQPGNK